MVVNITPVMRKLNMQREILQKLKAQKADKITKKVATKISAFERTYSQVKSKTTCVNRAGQQLFNYAGNPNTDVFKFTPADIESAVSFKGVDAVASYGANLIKEIGEIK